MSVCGKDSLDNRLTGIAVLIPAWEPDEHLVDLVRSLVGFPFPAVIVVNDGSDELYDGIFARVGAMPSVIVLRHDRNQGQGRAIRTAMRHAIESVPGLVGVVTSDADGQHAVQDIVRVAEATASSDELPVLGARCFGAGVPLRSRFGNILTRYVFMAFSGYLFTDTQSGLRGVPRRWIPAMLRVRADRYEFVASMLAEQCRLGIPPREVAIETIYFNRNRRSHFRPVRDSVRIYLSLFRTYAATIVPACADLIGFALTYAVARHVGGAVLMGRAAAVIADAAFTGFSSTPRMHRTYALMIHVLLLMGTGLVAYAAIGVSMQWWNWNAVAAKLVAEAAIWLALSLLRKTARVQKNGGGT